jgi:hypothetical protein
LFHYHRPPGLVIFKGTGVNATDVSAEFFRVAFIVQVIASFAHLAVSEQAFGKLRKGRVHEASQRLPRPNGGDFVAPRFEAQIAGIVLTQDLVPSPSRLHWELLRGQHIAKGWQPQPTCHGGKVQV